MACQNCLDEGTPENCTHMFNQLPPWQHVFLFTSFMHVRFRTHLVAVIVRSARKHKKIRAMSVQILQRPCVAQHGFSFPLLLSWQDVWSTGAFTKRDHGRSIGCFWSGFQNEIHPSLIGKEGNSFFKSPFGQTYLYVDRSKWRRRIAFCLGIMFLWTWCNGCLWVGVGASKIPLRLWKCFAGSFSKATRR